MISNYLKGVRPRGSRPTATEVILKRTKSSDKKIKRKIKSVN